MNINTKLKKAAIGVAVVAAAATATLAATTGPAAAAMGKGRVQLCSQGNYSSYLVFNGTNEASLLIPPGSCAKTSIPVNTYQIKVVGKWNSSNATFTMGSFPATPNDDPGFKVYTVGSTANGGATTGFLVARD